MPYKKKMPFYGAFYFIVLLPVSFVLIVLEGVYLNSQISAVLIPLTIGIFSGLAAYLGAKRREVIGTGADSTGGKVKWAFKDDALSNEYSEESKRLMGKDIEVYRRLNDKYSKKWSPAFSVYGRTPKVILSEAFFFRLNCGEKRALMLHEIYHYVHRDMTITYLLALLFVISAGGFLISLIQVMLFGMSELIYEIIVSFLLASIVFIGILKLHLEWQEYRSDKFAASEMGEKDDIKAVIKKASEYAKAYTEEEKNKRIEVLLVRRLRHLE